MSNFLSASASNDGRPPTASSIDTDITGNNGGTSVISTSGPVGETGLPPSRQTDGARNSRRGFAAFGARPKSQRPESANNSTHIPLASSNFFRPMSSQKLQAQRGQNIPEPARQQSISEEANVELRKSRTRSHRNSIASVHTMREAGRKDDDAPPLPVSRGGYSVATSAGGAPLGGSVDSTAPLDTRTPQQREKDEKAEQKKRLGLGLGSRHSSRMDIQDTNGRNASHPNSTSTSQEKPFNNVQSSSRNGRNYEYFGGNMLFFFLGRCLNTRAKPLNLLTLILAVFPAVLFFIFSARYLWTNISPAIPIIFAYIFLLTLSSFHPLKTKDPSMKK